MVKLATWQATVQDDDSGAAIISPVVTVRLGGPSGDLADIFDISGSAIGNPITGTAGGFVQFQARPGRYWVQAAGDSNLTDPWYWDAVPDEGLNWGDRGDLVTDVSAGMNLPDGSVVSDGTVQYIATSGATAIPDLLGWLPFGDVTPNHFVENAVPGTTDMLAAFALAYAYTPNVSLLNENYYHSDTIPLTRDAGSLIGPGRNSLCFMSIDPTTTVPSVIIGKADPVAEGRLTGFKLKGVTLAGGGNALRTRHAIEVQRGERVNIDDVRSTGHYSFAAFYGGQFNSLVGFNHGGAGSATVIAGTSSVKVDQYDLGGASYEPAFTINIDNFFVSSGPSNGTAHSFEILSSDGLEVTNGYCARAGQSKVKLGPSIDGNQGAAFFTNVYFDGVTTAGGSPLGLEIPNTASAGTISAEFTSCFFGQYDGDVFDVDNAKLGLLKFTGCNFANASGNLGTIQSGTSSEGKVIFDSCMFGNAGPLTIGSMESFSMSNAIIDNVSGTNSVSISGSFGSKSWDNIQYIGGSNEISDTGTGADMDPKANWYEVISYTPTLSFTGGSTGITYTTQTGSCYRIGNTYHFNAEIVLSSIGTDTGQVRVSMPVNHGAAIIPLTVYVNNIGNPSADGAIAGFATNGVSALSSLNGLGVSVQLTDADLLNNSQIYVSGTLTV